ncbi:protein cornichon homolog 4-like [Cynara cardunculus var. scolymus]|uniref:protein cornichon homolog 4-like n=1 Tax=Cynara cardunculus var. scolymus TaxID=59895 RepID=UPI000D624369|nr:protein cornichon homolog 4-like [Cynara cardunculus var. scolymus]
MGDLIAWLFSFFILLAVIALVLYQIMCFLDLETDYINPYELASKINNITLPEFITQGVLCCLHLITLHWIMFLLCLPYLCYNVNLYIHGHHLVYATEVFSELSREKKQRIFKLVYLAFLLFFSIFWMIWSIVDED